MRISTIQAFNNGVLGMQNNYNNVTRSQEQISSGKRVMTPADDPVASVRLLQLEQQAGKLEQFKANVTAATNSLSQEEATLDAVNNILQRVREITLEAGNGALSKADRQALAQELVQREDELLGLMNTRNARGEYLFGGFQGDTAPFSKNADGTYQYNGDEGQRFIQIGSSKQVAINDNGKNLFVDVGNVNRMETRVTSGNLAVSLGTIDNAGAFDAAFPTTAPTEVRITAAGDQFEVFNSQTSTWSTPQDLVIDEEEGFATATFNGVSVRLEGTIAGGEEFTVARSEKRNILDNIAMLRQNLETGGDTPEDKRMRSDILSTTLQNLDNGMNKVLSVQTTIGARMNVLESTANENDEISIINQTIKSGLEDLDYAEALSKLSLQSVVLQAAQQSFVKVSGMNLFNFLR